MNQTLFLQSELKPTVLLRQQAKAQHAQAARADAIPAGRPELCPTSRKLLQHIQSRSIAASQVIPVPKLHAFE